MLASRAFHDEISALELALVIAPVLASLVKTRLKGVAWVWFKCWFASVTLLGLSVKVWSWACGFKYSIEHSTLLYCYK